MVTAAMKLKDACSLEEKLRQHVKKQRHYFVNKGPSSQGYGFSSGRVWMAELDHKEDSTEELTLLNSGANRWRNNVNSGRLYFWGAPKSLRMVIAAMKLTDTCSLEGKL